MSTLPQTNDEILPEIEDTESSADLATSQTPRATLESVPVKISAVLGKVKLDIAQLKSLGAGSIIELDRKVGEPIDLYVNDRLIARGELVMVDGALGVTMTEIVKHDDL